MNIFLTRYTSRSIFCKQVAAQDGLSISAGTTEQTTNTNRLPATLRANKKKFDIIGIPHNLRCTKTHISSVN